jgi:hypothetical protein
MQNTVDRFDPLLRCVRMSHLLELNSKFVSCFPTFETILLGMQNSMREAASKHGAFVNRFLFLERGHSALYGHAGGAECTFGSATSFWILGSCEHSAYVSWTDSSEDDHDEDKTESVPEWRDTTVPLSLSFLGIRGDNVTLCRLRREAKCLLAY